MPTISPVYDIKSLIERYASIEVKYQSVVKGVLEIHSNCPWCPCSKDSFIMEPETGRFSHAVRARGCGRTGDGLDFLKEYCNMSHAEACEVLGLEVNQDYEPSKPSKSVQNGKESPPPARWQEQGKLLVESAQAALWSSGGKEMLDYLHARGLGDEIIKNKKLGYVPLQSNGRFYEAELDQWGLDPEQCKKDKVRVPNGILIPWFEGSTLWRLALKRPDQPKGKDYGQVVGSGEGLFNVDTIQYDTPAMIVEAEFCAMAVEQEAGTLVSCVATGSTTRARLSRWLAELEIASYALQSFDEDESGDEGAEYWIQTLQKCLRWSPYIAKDPNDILKRKYFEGAYQCSIREWVESGIQSAEVEFGITKPAIFHKTEDEKWEYVQKPTPPCKVDNALEVPQIIAVEPIDPYIMTALEVLDLADRLEGDTYVLDLETTGLNPRKSKVITIALGTVEQVVIIDTRGFYASTDEEKLQWRGALQKLLHREDITWAGHNLKFDWSFLAMHFGVKLSKVYDTMLVEKLIHNGERVSASLLNTAARYDLQVTKEERNWFVGLDQRPEWHFPFPPEQLRYIEQDIRVPHQIIESQQAEITRQKLKQVIELENAALPAIASLEVQGIAVDVDRWQKIIEVKQARKDRLEEELKVVLGEALLNQQEADEQGGMLFYVRPKMPDVNLASSDQLISALAALGVVVFGASREVLEEVKDAHEVIPLLLEWKELEKFLTAFGTSLMKYVENGRIHATFDQLGAVSGRIICREPNLQQIPKALNEDENLRSCFVAPDGHKLLVADLSNIELRILAEASGDPTMLRFFAEGKDLHSETARLMFNLSPDTDTKKHIINGVKARDIAKTINFGLAYGMGPSGLAGRVGVDLETAKKLMQTYFNTYKGVDNYLKRSGRNGTQQGYTVSLSGRRRTFPDLQDPKKRGEAERAAKNHPIQGTNADILKRALALLFERLPEEIHVVLTVHDEIVLEAPIDTLDSAEKLLKDSMMDACRDFLKKVAIPDPDVLIAEYWVKG